MHYKFSTEYNYISFVGASVFRLLDLNNILNFNTSDICRRFVVIAIISTGKRAQLMLRTADVRLHRTEYVPTAFGCCSEKNPEAAGRKIIKIKKFTH